jgi:hypothetical protein
MVSIEDFLLMPDKFVRTVVGTGATALAALGMSGAVFAQAIYSCVDGAGRKITADRPISECSDRAQKKINPSGTVKVCWSLR